MAGAHSHGWVLVLPVLLHWGKALRSSSTSGSKAPPRAVPGPWSLLQSGNLLHREGPTQPHSAPPGPTWPHLPLCSFKSRLDFQVPKDLIQFGHISLELSSNLEPKLPLLSHMPSRVPLPAQFSLLLVPCVSENSLGPVMVL